jgi:hypothetical protein
VEDEEYEGKKRRRVRWINSNNSDGAGSLKGSDIKMLAAKYGSKFRALSGGVPVKPTTATTAKPKPQAGDVSSIEECWELLRKAHPGSKQAELENEWREILAAACPGKRDFKPADWQKVKVAIIADGKAF